MSRLTQTNYLIHRQFLRHLWLDRDGACFADLPLQAQLDLHDYYAPSIPITDDQALRHRAEMTEAFPSLPQKAGRAYEALRAAIDGTPNQRIDKRRKDTTTTVVIAGERRSLRIAGIAHPSISHYRLARALLNLERHDVDGKLYAKAKKIRDRRLR